MSGISAGAFRRRVKKACCCEYTQRPLSLHSTSTRCVVNAWNFPAAHGNGIARHAQRHCVHRRYSDHGCHRGRTPEDLVASSRTTRTSGIPSAKSKLLFYAVFCDVSWSQNRPAGSPPTKRKGSSHAECPQS